MLDKLTENMRFMILVIVYTSSLTWWGAKIDASVKQQAETIRQQYIISQKTIELLDTHIKECEERRTQQVLEKEKLKHLRNDVNKLMDRV